MPPVPFRTALIRGFRASWVTIALIAAINTGIAGVLWIDDTRPFWHPFVSAQLQGFSIAWCVNVARPWDAVHPLRRLIVSVAIGSLLGIVLVILAKGYTWSYVTGKYGMFLFNVVVAFFNGVFVSLFFYVKLSAARAQATLARAEAERHLLSKQAVEAELKLMQAQIEPHFLFNTLANVKRLYETSPGSGRTMLGHLIQYLRAALPSMRQSGSSVRRELDLVRSYLTILQFRMGDRLAFSVEADAGALDAGLPPIVLPTLVENAIKHGLSPLPEGGRIDVRAHAEGGTLVVEVRDTGAGFRGSGGAGVGLANTRQRLATLYGERASLELAANTPRGVIARLQLPLARAEEETR